MLSMRAFRWIVGLFLTATLAVPAVAGVMLEGTRVILGEMERETSIPVKNTGKSPYVVQAWVDSDEPGGKAPFVVTPPLSRLDPGAENILRIMRVSGNLPADRESAFRLNVKEIPEKAQEDNVLQIAVRTRIKMFYRPSGLAGKPTEARSQLRWNVMPGTDGKGVVLKITNPSAYHVTFTGLTINHGQQEINADMVPPLGESVYPLTGLKTPQTVDVTYTTLNDYGGETPRERVQVPASVEPVAVKIEPVPDTTANQ